jgi:predicted Zn finger-like uncharacterized protein
MKIVCDSCATKYSISDDKVRGKVFKIRCKKCSHIIVVRGTNDAAAPAAGTGGSDGGWHLVVDGEQVGPLPEAEIRGRFSRGEINAETYIWKEGFADWLKLGAVAEFADIAGPGPSDASGSIGGGDLFSDSQPVSAPHAQVGEAVVAQQAVASSSGRVGGGLFSAIDAVSASAGGGGDAFAAPVAAVARGGGGDLFAAHAATAAVGGDDGRRASNHDGGRVENLTGQRHENSVLFSLANLQSLAMPSAKPASSGGALASTGPSEGSGLIDIRAMAATTMGNSDGRAGLSDDLPAFGSFSAAAPVLLPVSSQSGPPKWLFAVIGGMVLLLGAIGVMTYKIFTAKPVTVIEQVAAPPAPAAPAVAPVAPAAPANAAAAAAAPAAPSSPTIADENLPPREGAPAPADAKHERGEHAERGEKGGRHGKGKDRDKKGGGASGDSSGGKAASAPAVAAAEPEKETKKAAPRSGGNSLDDLLDNALSGRKPRKAASSDDDGPAKKAPEPVAAGPLAKDAVVRGMNGVRSKVSDCYNQFKVSGTAMVDVVIAKTGKVTSATAMGKFAGTPTGACVEKAVKSASFPPSDGLHTPYPFMLK